jgi:hypothetical protein
VESRKDAHLGKVQDSMIARKHNCHVKAWKASTKECKWTIM